MAVVFTIKITTTELSTLKRSDSTTDSPSGRVSKVQGCGSSEPNFTQAIAARAQNGRVGNRLFLTLLPSNIHKTSRIFAYEV